MRRENFTLRAGRATLPLMDKLMDQVEVDIACGQCGRKQKHPVSWLIENTEFVCPMCGAEQDFTSPEWQAKIKGYIEACSDFDV